MCDKNPERPRPIGPVFTLGFLIWGVSMQVMQRQQRQDLKRTRTRGFSLLELLVVISITAILTAVLFPGLAAARSSAMKLICSSHLHSLSTGLIMYSSDNNDKLPKSRMAEADRPLDQMAVSVPDPENPGSNRFVLDGLGHLVDVNSFGCYCDAAVCLFCPAHTNTHDFERYEDTLNVTMEMIESPQEQIWSNYQYVGQKPRGEDDSGLVARLRDKDVVVTDGFRTRADFNHVRGMNRLYGDGSIQWWQDVTEEFYYALPPQPVQTSAQQLLHFNQAWGVFTSRERD